MNISILRRIEAAEQRVKRVAEPPTLIMIHYDDCMEKKWVVTEHYTSGNWKNPNDYRTERMTIEKLQDFFFPADFKGRVILDTFASPDPTIYGNLFCFDMDDLREGQPGEIAIQSITEPENERSITVSIDTYLKEKRNRKEV